jgi:formate hydrogenlyase subunit 3/multisubunit Na+/H+ antiporter MnhD subunit
MQDLGKYLVILGIVIAIAGAWLWSGRGFGYFGRLPGDISYQRDNFGFYFPLTTCLVISAVLTLIAWFFRR